MLLLEVDYALQGHWRINPAVIGRHGVIDPVNIKSAQTDTPITGITIKDTPHQNILHLHVQAKNGYRHPLFKHFKLIAESARMKRQEAAIGCLTLDSRNDDRKAIVADER